MRLLFLPFIFLLSYFQSFSQLVVTANSNADSLAALLAGPNMIISNATLNCLADTNHPCGIFDGSASNLGINSGILLTTGDIKNAVGPNSSGNITASTVFTFNDPDLMTIDPLAINDVCILQFVAKPSCDSIYVKFSFGSDEYPEFVNSQYNDAFGIFVTGPNPFGPAYSGYNMTMIPNTSSPVSINNVNNGTVCPATGPCMNCIYYVDNCGGTSIEYDGFTKVIQKTLQVVAFQPYQFKFAIADAGDHAFDSGVFFGLGSFSCLGGVSVPESGLSQVSASVSPNPFNSGAILSLHGASSGIGNPELTLFNACGTAIRNLRPQPGTMDFLIDGHDLPGGIYFYSVGSDGNVLIRGKVVVQ